MITHPKKDQLAEFAWDALEGAAAETVEKHVAACAECALHVERVRIEARKLAAALETPVPAGLAARILDAATPARGTQSTVRIAPWMSIAAAALFATVAVWAWHGQSDANNRIDRLEKELAIQKKGAGPVVASSVDEEFAKALMKMDRDRLEGAVAVFIGTHPNLSPADAEQTREVFLAASERTSESLLLLARGEADMEMLATTDMWAGIDPDLRAKLSPEAFEDVVAGLQLQSRAAATAVARAMVGELQNVAALDRTQSSSIESYVVEKTAWRRDFHFLPNVAQREIVARLLGFGNTLRPEVSALLNRQQQASVVDYLENAATERKKYWENLRKKS